MTRCIVGVLALCICAATAASNTRCDDAYARFIDRLSRSGVSLSGQRLATLHRKALRLYDACDMGHLSDIDGKLLRLQTDG